MVQNRTERAYAILKTRIVDGTYAPGFRLVIDQLARESDISAIPWRESLRRLEAEGWVEIVPHAGARVRTFDPDAWVGTVRVLARLEGLATALGADRIGSAEIAEARGINREMRDALASFDPGRYGALNQRFHELLCGHADDQRLAELLRAEWTRLELVRRGVFWYAPGRAPAAIAEHEHLLDLLEGGASADVVERVACRHRLNTLDAAQAAEQASEPLPE